MAAWDVALRDPGTNAWDISLSGGATQLIVQDAARALAADGPALTQHSVLVVADALLALAAENPALTQHNALAVADALLALLAESPTLTAHDPAVQLRSEEHTSE